MDYGMKQPSMRTGGVKPSREMAAAAAARASRSGRSSRMLPRRGLEKGSTLWPAPASMMGSSMPMVGNPSMSSRETMRYK